MLDICGRILAAGCGVRIKEDLKANEEVAQLVHSSKVMTMRKKVEQALPQAERDRVEGWLNDVDLSSHKQ